MSKLSDYYIIHGWMQNKEGLGLKRLELYLYAIIYGYSKDGNNSMFASTTYLADMLNTTQPKIVEALKNLIIKETVTNNGFVLGCKYIVNFDMINNFI